MPDVPEDEKQLEWDYSRNAETHDAYKLVNGEDYNFAITFTNREWRLSRSVRVKEGYDLYIKKGAVYPDFENPTEKVHGKTVKELKLKAEERLRELQGE